MSKLDFFKDCKNEMERTSSAEVMFDLASCYFKGYLSGLSKAASMINEALSLTANSIKKGGEKNDRERSILQ